VFGEGRDLGVQLARTRSAQSGDTPSVLHRVALRCGEIRLFIKPGIRDRREDVRGQ
jgi:hypothetical protein